MGTISANSHRSGRAYGPCLRNDKPERNGDKSNHGGDGVTDKYNGFWRGEARDGRFEQVKGGKDN